MNKKKTNPKRPDYAIQVARVVFPLEVSSLVTAAPHLHFTIGNPPVSRPPPTGSSLGNFSNSYLRISGAREICEKASVKAIIYV